MYAYHPYKGKAVFSATDPGLRHRPTDRDSMQREALSLCRAGLKPRDIAAAFGISVAAVIQLLHPRIVRIGHRR
jgi:transposase-like protein